MNVPNERRFWSMGLALLFVAVGYAALAQAAESVPAAGAGPKSLIFGDGDTLWDIFLRGGKVMWAILAASIVGLTFFFERAIELRRPKHAPKDFDKDLVHIVDTRGVDAGLAACADSRSSLSRVLYAALLRYGTTRQEMEMAIQDEGTRLLYDLRRNGRVIGIMSNVSPLMGLLGTVLGLINAFDQVAAHGGTGKAAVLASGVAEALLTTAFGLIVAIPLLFMYHYAKGKADDLVREIEERALDAIVTLDRKARRSIRQIEDVEEHLETKDMVPPKEAPPPDLEGEFEATDEERGVQTSIATPAHAPALSESQIRAAMDGIDEEGATQVDVKALTDVPETKGAQAPKQIQPPAGQEPRAP